jgi:hypothetical protein
MNRPTKLRQWLLRNKSFVRGKSDSRELTHLLMDGGKIHVSQEKHEEFLQIFAEDIKLGGKENYNFISENRTPIFRFLVDIDYLDEYGLTDEEIERDISQNIQIALKPFLETDLDKNKRKIIVCTTGESKSTMDHGFELKKTGIHIIWPNVYVDEQYAKFLRSVIIQYFENNLPKRPEYCQWDQVFDYAVVSSSGLRMKGSAKIMRCTGCKNKKGDRECCEICYGFGKIIPGKGRVYLPRLVLDGDGNKLSHYLEKLTKDNYYMLQQTCLRIYGKRKNFTLLNESQFPSWFDKNVLQTHLEKPKKSRKKGKKKLIGTVEDILKKRKSLKYKETIDVNSDIYKKVCIFMSQLFNNHKHYNKQTIVNMFKCGKKKNEYYIIQTDSKFCQNVNRCHSANHIWFLLNDTSICQKCFSESYNKKSICCSEFSSQSYSITISLRNLLYPERVEKQKENFILNQGLDIKIKDKEIFSDNEIEDTDIKNFPSLRVQMGIKDRLKYLEDKLCS